MISMPQPTVRQRRYPAYLMGLLLACVLPGVLLVLAQEPGSPLERELQRQLLQPGPRGETLFDWGELKRFYGDGENQPVWLGEAGPNRRAGQLRERLRQAEREGLVPQHYHTGLIEALWNAVAIPDRVRLELLLSSAFFDYARDVRSGRVRPEQVTQLWKIETKPLDPVAMLRQSLTSDDFAGVLDSLPPGHPGYQRLREALAQYRQVESLGGWPTIPEGPTLHTGMRDPRVAALRRRLQWEGSLNLPVALDDELFDKGLAYAVERFQVRHGLRVDGSVGKETLAELNASAGLRIEQIIYNMERWRWLPHALGRRHLIVNIPSYELIAYDNDQAWLSMPVIIGKLDRPTPATTGPLHTVVFNPYWTVPTNLALRDVIPRQRRNPDYMPSYRIRVFSDWNAEHELDPRQVDWSRINRNYFPYMLRQDPGPKNALGRIKFLFSNPFDVYLHDTPNVELFAEDVRTFSSGCIRVEEPLRLAAFLLEGEKENWSVEKVQEAIRTGETRNVPVSGRIPVYLLYFTAWVGEDNVVHFRRDIYGEDAMLAVCMVEGGPSC